MAASADILRMRVLLCFWNGTKTVMAISRELDEEHYTVTRAIKGLEEEGLVLRSGARQLELSAEGQQLAKRYVERMSITVNHLLYEGVDMASARHDAYYWALYNSDETMAVIRAGEELCRVKYELQECGSFTGSTLSKMLGNGVYRFPFLVYRETAKRGDIISMANNGFEHPCVLSVRDGVGVLQLKAVDMSARSGKTGFSMKGHVTKLSYYKDGRYVAAEFNRQLLCIPADALNFRTVGEGIGQILHGQVCLRMQCSVGAIHMPESTAIFTLLV